MKPRRRPGRFRKVCGLDEAGRGALAGPLVLAAVVMRSDFRFEYVAGDVVVRDSKKLSIRQRRRVMELVESYSLRIEIEVISVAEINARGIGWANLEGFRRLVERIEASEYVIDGRGSAAVMGPKARRVSFVIDADETIPVALAAGIVAKIRRDEIMQELDRDHPVYNWKRNTGHGTREHVEAIRKHGQCAHHRTRFVETALTAYLD